MLLLLLLHVILLLFLFLLLIFVRDIINMNIVAVIFPQPYRVSMLHKLRTSTEVQLGEY